MSIFTVYVGSVRDGRQGRSVADWVASCLQARGHTVHLVDPRDYEDLQVMRRMYKSAEDPSEEFTKLKQMVEESDGYVVCTPEYNHSYSGAIKNALDVFLEEYFFKCFGIVTYSAGGFGGIRAAEALRVVVAEMGAPATPTSLAISKVQDVFGDDGELLDESYAPRLEKFLDEFEWFVDALADKRAQGTPY